MAYDQKKGMCNLIDEKKKKKKKKQRWRTGEKKNHPKCPILISDWSTNGFVLSYIKKKN